MNKLDYYYRHGGYGSIYRICTFCKAERIEDVSQKTMTHLTSNPSEFQKNQTPYVCFDCRRKQDNGFKRVALKKDIRTDRSFTSYKEVSREKKQVPKWDRSRLLKKKTAGIVKREKYADLIDDLYL